MAAIDLEGRRACCLGISAVSAARSLLLKLADGRSPERAPLLLRVCLCLCRIARGLITLQFIIVQICFGVETRIPHVFSIKVRVR